MKKKEYILEYDMVFVNILSIIILILTILLTLGLCSLFNKNELIDFAVNIGNDSYLKFVITYFVFFVLMILWMVLHEIIHGVMYQVMGAKKENIVYGANIEKGVFYCKCRDYVDKRCIMTSLLSPFILIGVVTFIIGFVLNIPLLVILSIINICGASGDLMMTLFFLKQNDDIEFKEMGFSSPFCLRTTDDLTKKKFIGIKSIKLVEDSKETYEEPEKKITISKGTYIFLGIFLILIVLLLVLALLIK